MKYSFGILTFSKLRLLQLTRSYNSKIPAKPIKSLEKLHEEIVHVDNNTIILLERLSLVRCDNVDGVKILEDSIAFANKILHIDTNNIQPLYSVLEKENLALRADTISQGNCQKDILKNATVKEDDYFVSPPGNIPLHEIVPNKLEKKN